MRWWGGDEEKSEWKRARADLLFSAFFFFASRDEQCVYVISMWTRVPTVESAEDKASESKRKERERELCFECRRNQKLRRPSFFPVSFSFLYKKFERAPRT
jgi:hypothetical protein